MHKVLFVVPALGWKLHAFSLFLLLGCFAGLYLTTWRARREGIDPESVSELAIWLLTGGFLGARALYIAMHPESIQGPLDVFKVWQGGIVFYGCIMGGLAGSLLYWIRHPFPFFAMADAVAPALAIGAALGRVGCWFNGCCFGGPCEGPWGVRFPAGSPPWWHHVQAGWIPSWSRASLAVHPTQLYAVADALILLALLFAYYPRRRRDGEVMALLMVTYPITRFLIEGLRDDERPWVAGLTMAQGISVGLFLLGLGSWAFLATRPLGRISDAPLGAGIPSRPRSKSKPISVAPAPTSGPSR